MSLPSRDVVLPHATCANPGNLRGSFYPRTRLESRDRAGHGGDRQARERACRSYYLAAARGVYRNDLPRLELETHE